MCDVTKRRFYCACPTGFSGYKCQVVQPPSLKSCRDVTWIQKSQSNGIFNIVDQNNISFPVYCDFGSEPGMAWTLIQSHSLQKKLAFRKSFYLYDMPINQNAPEWNNYRLSMSRIQSIQNVSTHWRSTCNFPTDGVDYRDYWRVSLTNMDLLVKPPTSSFCLLSEFINVRGNNCTNCTVLTGYSDGMSLHMDSSLASCDFNRHPAGAVSSEDNFGHYEAINSAFRCSSSMNSTSQFWLGSF